MQIELLEIDFNSEEAIYMQLRNQIILGIATSRLQDGDTLPSVRQMADGICTHLFEDVYTAALEAGARGGKISGAGGGGYIFFYCPDCVRYRVIDVLNNFGGNVRRFEFTKEGLQTWQMDDK